MTNIKTKNRYRLISKSLLFVTSFFFGILLARTVHGQEDKALLWKISGKGIEQPSYLFGTIHMICKEDFKIDAQVESALKSCKQIVLELDMDDPQLMTQMSQYSLNKGMVNISSEFEPEDLKVMNTFFQSNYGADLSQLGILKPFAMLSMIIVKSLPCLPTEMASYEQTFVTKAAELSVPLNGLETVAFQMSLFDEVPMADQIKMLVETVSDKDKNLREFNQMVAAYKAQDLKQLYSLISESPQYAQYNDLLLSNRNISWVPKIKNIIKEQPTFIAVGAGHLGGEKGLINLLRSEGYQITPMN
jgi:uncharacterized protein YbaP (TraB family)